MAKIISKTAILLALVAVLISCSKSSSPDPLADCEDMNLSEVYALSAQRPESSRCVSIMADLVFRTTTICPSGAYFIENSGENPLYLRGRIPDAAVFPRVTSLRERVIVTGDFFPAEVPCSAVMCDCQRGLTVRDLYKVQ